VIHIPVCVEIQFKILLHVGHIYSTYHSGHLPHDSSANVLYYSFVLYII